MSENFDLTAVFENNRALFGNTRMEGEEAAADGETSQGTESSAPVGNAGGESTGVNPAWNEILSVLPDSLHPVVKPALEKWDTNYNNGIQKVHSEYEPYKAFKDGGYDPQTIQYALAILDKIENDPKSIYDALAEHNGWAEQGQNDSENPEYEPEGEVDPRILRAEQLAEAVAEYTMTQHQQQQEAAEDEALDAEIAGLLEENKLTEDPHVERFMLGLMLAGASAQDAMKEYLALTSEVATRPRANSTAPVVMGSGGGVPSGQISREQLRDKTTRKSLVAQMVANMNSDQP
jgi:hypothetical protein